MLPGPRTLPCSLGRLSGVGKSGLATSFLIHAINQGYSGRFAELLAQFYRSCADHSEAKLLSKYLSYDCLLIDEIRYVEVEAVWWGFSSP
jgi:DNA replication protein DnaC